MTGYRVGTRQAEPLPTDRYVCQRCGITRQCNPKRKKPTRCADCRSLECVRGHLFPADAARDRKGHLVCLECRREDNARRRATTTTARPNQEGTAA